MPLPPIYAIVCEELIDRREALREHLFKMGLDAIEWRGVHGETWGLDTTLRHGDGSLKLSPGHVGLILSHWNLWQHLLQSGINTAIICEDDAIFPPDFPAILENFESRLPPWDFVHIGHICGEGRIKRHVDRGVVELDWPLGTHCYMVNWRAIQLLLRTMRKAWAPVDTQLWLSTGNLLRMFAAWPSIVQQRTYSGEWESSLVHVDKGA